MLTRVNSAIFWGFLELCKGEQNILNTRTEEANQATSF